MCDDVPSPINLQDLADAKEWERSALQKRPSRPEFFELFTSELSNHHSAVTNVLELGSGPGFLAEHLLNKFSNISYVALDFSGAMHELSRLRLGVTAVRVNFVERSFKETNWTRELGKFSCVVTNQAVHELRHKRHASALHREVRTILESGGLYLVCDHFAGSDGMANRELYMTQDEQRVALVDGGFSNPVLLKTADSLTMYRAAG
tara:strand:- start:3613 stop:4230 length:618 start_codon:yes stop_codon:yes gene_type:complete